MSRAGTSSLAPPSRNLLAWLDGLSRGRILQYGVAVLLPVLTLAIRLRMDVVFGQRPLLILFQLPILISAFIGGLGPGLVATFLTAAGVSYFLIPPTYSLRIESAPDAIQWLILILNGVLVSVFSALIRRDQGVRENQEAIAPSGTGRTQAGPLPLPLGRTGRMLLALAMPILACAIQWVLWDQFKPLIWFLFYPAVFVSAWVAGLAGALPAAALASALALYCFVPPYLTFHKPIMVSFPQFVVFLAMAALFGQIHDRLAEAERRNLSLLEAQRNQDRAALKSQEEMLARTSRLAKVGGWTIDVATGAGEWTEEVARIHDLDPSVPICAAKGIEFYSEDSRPIIEQAVKEAYDLGRAYDLELEILSAKGVHKWVRTQGEPVLEGDRVVRLQGTLQDITEQKLAQEEVLRLNATLEQRVEERTAELSAANAELEAFAYAVSHDLRAPLRAMSGFSQALVEDFAAALPPQANAYLDQIKLGSQRMDSLIDGLLALSRSTKGDLQRRSLDLSAMAEDVRRELEATDPERRVLWHISPGLQARGDSRMVVVVLRNLLGNAWKYSSKQAAPEIHFDAVDRDGATCFRVCDNGAGFDMAYAAKLFQPFQRLHRADEFPGIGIGLATVQRIVHRHGGMLLAESAPGRGATFLFTLHSPAAADGEP